MVAVFQPNVFQNNVFQTGTTPVLSRTLGYLGLAKESAVGVPVSPTRFIKHIQDGLDREQGVHYYSDGNVRDLTYGLKETFQWGGQGVRTLLYADEGAALLAWAMGTDVVSGAGPYLHTLSLRDGLPSLAVEKGIYEAVDTLAIQDVERLTQAKLNSLTVAGVAADYVTLTPQFVGTGSELQSSESTPVFSDAVTDGPMMFSDGAFTLTGPYDAGMLAAQIANFTLRLNQNIRVIYGPGQLVPIGLLEQRRVVSLALRAVFTSASVAQLAYYGISTGMQPSLTLGGGSFAATFTASAARVIGLSIPVLDYTAARMRLDPNSLEATVDLVCQPHKAGAFLPLTATALNGTPDAYC